MSTFALGSGDIARALLRNAAWKAPDPDLHPVIDLGMLLQREGNTSWDEYRAMRLKSDYFEDHVLLRYDRTVLSVRYTEGGYQIMHIAESSDWREALARRVGGTSRTSTTEVPRKSKMRTKPMRVRIEYSLDVEPVEIEMLSRVLQRDVDRDIIKEFLKCEGTTGLDTLRTMWESQEEGGTDAPTRN